VVYVWVNIHFWKGLPFTKDKASGFFLLRQALDLSSLNILNDK